MFELFKATSPTSFYEIFKASNLAFNVIDHRFTCFTEY